MVDGRGQRWQSPDVEAYSAVCNGGRYHVRLRAVFAHSGAPAYRAQRLHGRQLQSGQATWIGGSAIFAFNSATPTAQGKRLIRGMLNSLRYARAVTCEGYTDYGANPRHEQGLAKARAKAVCDELQRYAVHLHIHLHIKVIGYGPWRPDTIGGAHHDRGNNRRVVVKVTR